MSLLVFHFDSSWRKARQPDFAFTEKTQHVAFCATLLAEIAGQIHLLSTINRHNLRKWRSKVLSKNCLRYTIRGQAEETPRWNLHRKPRPTSHRSMGKVVDGLGLGPSRYGFARDNNNHASLCVTGQWQISRTLAWTPNGHAAQIFPWWIYLPWAPGVSTVRLRMCDCQCLKLNRLPNPTRLVYRFLSPSPVSHSTKEGFTKVSKSLPSSMAEMWQ